VQANTLKELALFAVGYLKYLSAKMPNIVRKRFLAISSIPHPDELVCKLLYRKNFEGTL
jgi:hypothetical protein